MNENKIELSGIFENGYGIIPKKFMQSKNLNVYDKCIIAYMLSYTGGGNTCFPSYKKIAEDLDISETTIAKSLKKLNELKYIRTEKLYPENKIKHNNKYILIFLNDASILNEVKPYTPPDEVTHFAKLSSNNNILNNNISNNNKPKIPTLQQIEQFIADKQIKDFTANDFFTYYDKRDWIKANNKPVLNWKNTVINWQEKAIKTKKENYIPTAAEREEQTKKELRDAGY